MKKQSETLSVLWDLISPLPPRAALALMLVAEADANPKYGQAFRSLVNAPRPRIEFPHDQLKLWCFAGIVYMGGRPSSKRADGWEAVVWIEPGSVGDACLGIVRHGSLPEYNSDLVQFPGVSLGRLERITRGLHPATGTRILNGKKCGGCAHFREGNCNKARDNDRTVAEWVGCGSWEKQTPAQR